MASRRLTQRFPRRELASVGAVLPEGMTIGVSPPRQSVLLIDSLELSPQAREEGRRNGLPTIAVFEPEKYTGRWYEIAKLPLVWERGCLGAIADYGWDSISEVLSVKNSCLDEEGEVVRVSKGMATIPDESEPGKLSLQFEPEPFPKGTVMSELLPQERTFTGDYWIHDTDYKTYSIVGGPNRDFVWLLSRDEYYPYDQFKKRMEFINALGYDVNAMTVWTDQLEGIPLAEGMTAGQLVSITKGKERPPTPNLIVENFLKSLGLR